MEVDINKVEPNDYNPKVTEDNMERFKAIVEGIRHMGMKTPIDVREDGDHFVIIDGYHRWRACKELGWETIPISSWGKISENQAKKISILKETARVPLDLIRTSEVLNELASNTPLDVLALQLGYSLPELKEDLKVASFNWKPKEEEKKEGEIENNEKMATLSVILTHDQFIVVNEAMEKVRGENKEMSDGRALELISAEFLS